MMNSPMAQIMNAMQNGADPNQIAMHLAQQIPAVHQAMQAMNGRTPDQIRDMAQQMAAQRGIDLNQVARQLGVQLPR